LLFLCSAAKWTKKFPAFCRVSTCNRLAGRADKIRRRLGWPVGILNATPRTKPKGMHWQTFKKLTAEHDALVGASLAGRRKNRTCG
jgi:hypothetical protein